MKNQFYFKLFILVNKVKWSQELLLFINSSTKQHSFIYTQLNVKTVVYKNIQFSISTLFCFIWPIDWALSGATIPGQSLYGSNGRKRFTRCILQSQLSGQCIFCVFRMWWAYYPIWLRNQCNLFVWVGETTQFLMIGPFIVLFFPSSFSADLLRSSKNRALPISLFFILSKHFSPYIPKHRKRKKTESRNPWYTS